jgi:hypothetical protein
MLALRREVGDLKLQMDAHKSRIDYLETHIDYLQTIAESTRYRQLIGRQRSVLWQAYRPAFEIDFRDGVVSRQAPLLLKNGRSCCFRIVSAYWSQFLNFVRPRLDELTRCRHTGNFMMAETVLISMHSQVPSTVCLTRTISSEYFPPQGHMQIYSLLSTG